MITCHVKEHVIRALDQRQGVSYPVTACCIEVIRNILIPLPLTAMHHYVRAFKKMRFLVSFIGIQLQISSEEHKFCSIDVLCHQRMRRES